MRVHVLGDNLEAWTLAGALAQTGCRVSLKQTGLPRADSDMGEPDLQQLLEQQQAAGRLQLGREHEAADLLLVAERHASQESLQASVQAFLGALDAQDQTGMLVALVQPVAIGTTEQLQQWLDDHGAGHVRVLYWPAFIQSGRALESVTRPERILLGCDDEAAIRVIRRLLTPFNRRRDTLLVMSPKEAELSKLAINGMLATRISYMNELAQLAADKGIDIERVRQGMGTDSRIGFQYLYPGCGFGGESFLETLAQLNRELDNKEEPGLLSRVFAINEQQKDLLFQKFWRYFKADIQGRTVALWGCAFKPNTSGVEGSPALTLLRALLAHDVKVRVYDPMALPTLRRTLGDQPGVSYMDSAEQAATGADALMLVTEWKEFWNLDMEAVLARMNTPLLLDGRNLFEPERMAELGWHYSGVGRGVAI
ncbi:nucleotide sugar dehydrogenase [Marinobacterium sediminicola]|uniref:UDP-glucose 6-dehydrogenase n=1 Tax=Marinobacterium sediminicola TaxID=518898 RepID=A0ABY1S0L3_9GAMM|nr:nucleotide sugar dehydrogenase [Marinobacterium sediminicola]ULG68379.1 nucleotide sugar dehydrogenase [Marinobacterium sediminicola]SMR74742.1 UDPglucose 6-dehydrogenase [Marinobacterium sediminicola]